MPPKYTAANFSSEIACVYAIVLPFAAVTTCTLLGRLYSSCWYI